MTNNFSCFLTQKGRWLTATLFLLFSLGIGQMWGTDQTFTVTNPTTDVNVSGPITIQGEYQGSKKVDNTNQKTYVNNNGPLYIQSKAANIKKVTVVLSYTGNGSGTYKAVTIKTMNGTDFSVPETGVSATLDENALTSLSDILINNNNTSHQTLEITCSTKKSAVSIDKGSQGSIVIKSVSVVYDDAISAPNVFSEGHFTSTTAGSASNGCSWGTFTLHSTTPVEVSSKSYYKRGSANAITYNLASGEKLAAGDVILLDYIPGTGANKTTAITLTNGPVWSQKTNAQTEHNFIYVVPTGSALIDATSFSFSIQNNDTYVYGVQVYHTSSGSTPDPGTSCTTPTIAWATGSTANISVLNELEATNLGINVTEYTGNITWALSGDDIVTLSNQSKTGCTVTGKADAYGTATLTASFTLSGDATLCDGTYSVTKTITIKECVAEPATLTNEIARFQVPCDVDNTEVLTSPIERTECTCTFAGVGGDGNWYQNPTSGLWYGKMNGNGTGKFITITLKSGAFQAGDVVTIAINRDNTTKSGFYIKTTSGNTVEPESTASGVEAIGTYTLTAGDIDDGGSLTFFRSNSSTYVNRIIVTREPSCDKPVISAQPEDASLAVGDANPTLSFTATGATSYAWKESSDGTSYDGESALVTTANYTPEVNDAVQTKYYYCELTNACGTIKTDIVTVNVAASITYYTVTLVPAGGTIDDATDWTLNEGNYTKTVAEGTELTLPTFTKANRTFKTWRNGAVDVTSPITVTGDVTLTAVWNATVDNVIYSWESPSGTVIETGGTAVTYKGDDPVDGDPEVNVLNNGNYVLQVSGDNTASSSKNHIRITLTSGNAVKSGDKVKLIAYANNPSNNTRPRLIDGSGNQLCVAGSNMPAYTDPYVGTLMVADGINTELIKVTRASGYTGTNTMVKKLQIVRPTLVEEANLRTVTFNYNDGVTANVTVEVASGATVSAPADPTRAHYRFNGWKLNSAAYDFSTPVTSNIMLTADWTQLYTVTYAKGEESATGDAPTQDELAAGEKFTVAANTFAYDGHDFSTWNDGSKDVAPASEYTMGSADVTLTAQWVTAATKVTVTYKDGETTLGSEEITINTGNPVGYATYQTRNLATFDGWYNDPDLAEGHKIADISALTASANVNVYGKWNYQYASSVNIEQWTLDNGKGVSDAQKETQTGALVSLLGTRKFASNIAYDKGNIELDSLNDDPGKTNRNYAYLGLKVKKSGKMLDFRLAKDSYVNVKFGNVAATPKVSINGADYADMSLTDGVYSYTATGNDYVSIKTASDGALVFKQIMINEDIQAVALPWKVTYDANGGTCATESAAGASVTLPAVTAPADYTFTGWYNGDTKVGNAGQAYVPTSNITLQAHFAPVEYAIAYDGNGATSGSMSAGVAGWGTLVTPATNAYEKTGYVFSGWVITKTSDGSATGITFSEGKFEMPKYDVTLVAQWDDVSKVVKIVETDVKYETFADAIAAVGAGQTIQLIQSCSIADTWAVDGIDVTLDLNGQTLTSTKNGDAVAIVNGGKLTIEDGTATVDPTINNSDEITYASGKFTSVKWHINVYDGGEFVMNSGWLVAEEAAVYVEKNCTVTINGGVLESNGNGVVMGDGTPNRDNYEINIHGGLLVGRMVQEGIDAGYVSMVVYHPNIGTLNIDGGKFVSTNGPCIVTRGGATNITGGEIIAKGTAVGKCGNASQNLGAVGIAIDFKSAYPGVANTNVAISGSADVSGAVAAVQAIYASAVASNAEVAAVGISGGTFNTVLSNAVCAEGYVPVTTPNAQGKYTVEPKDGTEIIGVVVTGNTEGTVSGLYKGNASIKLNNKKLDNGDYYIYVTLKEGYTFEENDVLIVDVNGKSDLSGGNKALEITTGVGNIDGAVWKSIAVDDYTTGENTISLAGIAAGQTSIGLKRSTNQNAKINGLRVLRPMNPVLKKVTVATVEGTPDNTNHVAIEVPFTTADDALDAIAYEWVSNSDAWTAAHAPAVANTWAWGEENTVTLTDKDGDASVYYVTISKAVPSSDATLATLTYGTPATAIALADGVFEYNVELPYGTSAVPTLAATAHHVGANVTDITDDAAFVNRHATSTVTVKAEDNTTTQLYKVNFTVSRFESKVLWDGSTMSAMSDITAAATAAGVAVTTTGISVTSFSAVTCEENGKSYTKALDFGGKTQSTRNFGIEIPAGKVAKVSVVYKAKGTGARSIIVGTALASVVDESAITVVACEGDATYLHIMTADMFGGGTLYINTTDGFHVHEISLQLADGHARSAMLGADVYGTVCVPNNVAVEDIQGVTVYELMGREPQYGKLAFDEIISGELEAGVPYVFQAHGNHMALLYGTTHVDDPVDKGNGMYGTFEDVTFYAGSADDIYFFRDHALWSAKETGVKILANRAYVKLSEIDYLTNPNPAPGRRRVTMAINGKDTATDFENLEASETPVKLMINGQIFILRGEKLYDATGRLVK